MSVGPFATETSFANFVGGLVARDDALPYVISVAGQPSGMASYLRINLQAASIEVGFVFFGPTLRRSRAATEAMFLMMQEAFALGFRRYEWKCDALNGPSRAAALRLGFQFEGVFRQATHYKGRNRDTAWFSVIDCEWPRLQKTFEVWLHSSNFDPQGEQRRRLSKMTSSS